MSLKQWYHLLLEDSVTMYCDQSGNREYIPCRREVLHPDVDWENTWRLARQPGLGSENTSFLFRILHDLLPTRERLNRVKESNTAICKLCSETVIEDQTHAFFSCSFNRGAGLSFLQTLPSIDSTMTPEKALNLQWMLQAHMELPVVLLSAAFGT